MSQDDNAPLEIRSIPLEIRRVSPNEARVWETYGADSNEAKNLSNLTAVERALVEMSADPGRQFVLRFGSRSDAKYVYDHLSEVDRLRFVWQWPRLPDKSPDDPEHQSLDR